MVRKAPPFVDSKLPGTVSDLAGSSRSIVPYPEFNWPRMNEVREKNSDGVLRNPFNRNSRDSQACLEYRSYDQFRL